MFELRKARERGHVLEGLAVALANIDDFIRHHPRIAHTAGGQGRADDPPWDSKLVREMLTRTRADGGVINADDYRPEGLEREFGMGRDGLYRLSETQAQEILQMRLQRLTGPGAGQDRGRVQRDVMAVIDDLLDILAKPGARVRPSLAKSSPPSRRGVRPDQAGRAAARSSTAHKDLSTEDLITPPTWW